MAGLAEAAQYDADVLLATELGTTRRTQPLEGGRYVSDWGVGDKARFGEAVGAFFDNPWTGQWANIKVEAAPRNSRFYFLHTQPTIVILICFYAPQAGLGTKVRERFYKKLWTAVCEVRQQIPQGWCIMAGDANLPELFRREESGLEVRPKGTVAKFFHQTFLANFRLANLVNGTIAPTHIRGNPLDLILHDEGLPCHDLEVTKTGIAGSDHAMDRASFTIPGVQRPSAPLVWRLAQQVDWDIVVNKLEEPLTIWHEWLSGRLASPSSDVHSILPSAEVYFSIIVLGLIWATGSGCGKYAKPHGPRLVAHLVG
jgi:hypothetical protein